EPGQGPGVRRRHRLPAGPAAGAGRAEDEGADMIKRNLPFATIAVIALVAAPLLLEPFRLNLLAKYLCYAIVALGIGLAWGQGGMLTLGQGVFFGLGGYSMAMYLKLHESGGDLPDFMVWSGVEKLPALWAPFASPVFALTMAIAGPVLLAVV